MSLCTKKILKIILFVAITFLGFFGCKTIVQNRSLPAPKRNTIEKKQNSSRLPVNTDDHPYGNPVKGVLMWENDRKFHEVCAKYRTSVRLSAFKTTLPDPLPGEEYNVALAADLLAGTVIKPGDVFSMNGTVGPRNRERGFKEGPAYSGSQVLKVIGGGVCKIATTLYNVAVLANLKIMERWPHSMPVPYVPLGQDATVTYGVKDIKFKNTTGDPVLIWADTKDNTLYIALYGLRRPPQITWEHKLSNRQPTYNVYRVNRNLKPGETKIIIPGADGYTVKSWIIIKNSKGAPTKQLMGTDYYRPLPQLIERALPNYSGVSDKRKA